MNPGQSKHVAGGAVVVAAVMGETKILLIKETTKPTPHYWKLVSETVEPDEPILDALCRGVGEEAGLTNLETRLVDGKVVEITDSRLKAVRQLVPSHMIEKPRPHRRHFWGLLTTDAIVMSLSGKHLTGDVNEEIDTMAFNLIELDTMVDLLPKHRELIKQVTQKAVA